ncbi:MAG TPA: alkaline phosphatase family protein, partial [Bryobacteraceae bacterium]|nr:alkaline phosphatase family protein [Bryobacteraceae bacterium]
MRARRGAGDQKQFQMKQFDLPTSPTTASRRLLPLLIASLFAAAAVDASAQSLQKLPPIKTVFIIAEENHNWSDITPTVAPYIQKTLVPMGAHAEQYYTPPGNHPSEPNLIWLEAGSNLGITDDADPGVNHRNTVDHLVSYLDKAGISWKTYQEDIDGTSCPLVSVRKYAPKHNPFVFFDDVTGNNNFASVYCISHIRPYSELATDLENNTVARYNFITPNLCHDMHDCSATVGDTWLSTEVPKILASQAYKDRGALFIVWDEGSSGDGPIGMIVLSPFAKTNYFNSIHYTHSSTLKTL